MKNMEFIKFIVITVAMTVLGSSRADDSAPFPLDTRTGIRAARTTEPLAYSTDWNNTKGVSILLDGEILFEDAAPAFGA